MTDTAIRATFSDFRTVKTRKVCQLILEVPIEQANAALAALGGVPQFGEEQWVGVAPITAEPRPAPKKEMTRAQWAGMLCQDEKFQEFLWRQDQGEHSPPLIWRGQYGPEEAAACVRYMCGIESRSELDAEFPQPAAEKWDALRTEYDAWRGRIGYRGLG